MVERTRPAQALVLVDVQRGFVTGPAAVPDADALVERLEVLLGRARTAGALVVHLQNDGRAGQVDEPDTDGWHLVLEARPGAAEFVLRKGDDDGFAGTTLSQVLETREVDRLVIAGLFSEMCVSATARGALARGLQVVLPRDAHGTYDLDDIPAGVVARVAEHALGDQVELLRSVDQVTFTARAG